MGDHIAWDDDALNRCRPARRIRKGVEAISDYRVLVARSAASFPCEALLAIAVHSRILSTAGGSRSKLLSERAL
jgi:hypothetical protein